MDTNLQNITETTKKKEKNLQTASKIGINLEQKAFNIERLLWRV